MSSLVSPATPVGEDGLKIARARALPAQAAVTLQDRGPFGQGITLDFCLIEAISYGWRMLRFEFGV